MLDATLPICVKGTSLVPTFTGNFVMIFLCCDLSSFLNKYSKPVLSGHSNRDQILAFKTDYCIMLVKSIAEGTFCNTRDLH